ncbi:MAG: AAA family ATPase [Firmicutes bacterium]|nr:AAA family ATPase [Bacillota bacterium]
MNKEKENEKYYAILVSKNVIKADCYLYKPLCLIEGVRIKYSDEILFKDVTGKKYEVISESKPLVAIEEFYVMNIISEEELLKTYGNDINEAKENYMQKTNSKIYIGVHSFSEDRVKVAIIDYIDLAAKVENNDLNVSYELDDKKEKKVKEDDEIPTGDLIEVIEVITNEILVEDDILRVKKHIKDIVDKLVSMYLCVEYKDSPKVGYIKGAIEEFIKKLDKLINIEDLDELIDEYDCLCDDEIENINSIQLAFDEAMCCEDIDDTKDGEIKDNKEEIPKLSVREIKKYFDERIIGQEEAKKDIIQAIYMNKLSNIPGDRTACLLVGPTGSGKTLIAETVSGCFNMPIEIIDTTQLSVPGYVGANLEDFLERLLAKTDGNLKKAEEGIVVFDEIDKKGSGSNGDVSGKGVLNTLLPFIQGTTYDVDYKHKTYHFNTSKLTIFATGAFTDVVKEKKEKGYSSSGMGFESVDNISKEDIKYEELKIDDFVKYGNMPIELIGRFSTITQLTGHTKESLTQILVESKLSALLLEKEKLSKINVELVWEDSYIDAVVNYAMKLKTGARSLKSTVERSIKNARWEVLANEGEYSKIILTEDSVLDNNNCYLVTINGDKINLKDILLKEKQKIKRMGENL